MVYWLVKAILLLGCSVLLISPIELDYAELAKKRQISICC